MKRLVDVRSTADIFPDYIGTPIEALLRYHCLKEPLPESIDAPQIFIAMCIDHRKSLTIPPSTRSGARR